jgi:hypothetical protein
MRYGVDKPLPEQRTLHAGPLTAVLEQGDLRYITAGRFEVVRRLYMAVRDRNWDTIEPRFTAFTVEDRGDSFMVRFSAEHVSADVDFAWEGTIEGRADGTIIYHMDGVPRRSFLRNRIGFCVLHPMELAGTPVEVETPAGTVRGEFPRRISPHQPFVDMQAIRHPVGDGAWLSIRFAGDLFEMEDQRNWTDASYKTYCTPLRLPYPVEVTPDQRIVQTVTITLEGELPAVEVATESAGDVEIGTGAVGALPPIGLGAASHLQGLSAREVACLRALQPAHLWDELDLGNDGWRERLRQAVEDARALGAGLELSVVAAPDEGFTRLPTEISKLQAPVLRVFVFPPVQQPVVFPRHDLETTREIFRQAEEAFARASLTVPLGGGTRAYFTELNRALDLPLDRMAWVTYTINPQVHAFDNLSLVETLAAQAVTVASARAIVGDLPLAVGPITLRPRWNPNATAAPPEPGPDELPAEVDPRQLSLFGAGWTIGSIHRLAAAGARSLTYFETTGWRGLMERESGLTRRHLFPARPGDLFPIYHVFAALSGMAGAEVLPVHLREPLATEAIAVRHGGRLRVLVANLTDQERVVELTGPLAAATVRVLDETTYEKAAVDAAFFRDPGGEHVEARDLRLRLTLRPFAVARLDAPGG